MLHVQSEESLEVIARHHLIKTTTNTSRTIHDNLHQVPEPLWVIHHEHAITKMLTESDKTNAGMQRKFRS